MKRKLATAALMAISFVAGAAFMYWAAYGWLLTKMIETIERMNG